MIDDYNLTKSSGIHDALAELEDRIDALENHITDSEQVLGKDSYTPHEAVSEQVLGKDSYIPQETVASQLADACIKQLRTQLAEANTRAEKAETKNVAAAARLLRLVNRLHGEVPDYHNVTMWETEGLNIIAALREA